MLVVLLITQLTFQHNLVVSFCEENDDLLKNFTHQLLSIMCITSSFCRQNDDVMHMMEGKV